MVLAEGYILSSVLPDDVHVLLGFGEDGRLDKVPIIPDSVPTYMHCGHHLFCQIRYGPCCAGAGLIEVNGNGSKSRHLELGLGRLGSFRPERVTNLDCKRLIRELLGGLVVNTLMYEYSQPS